MICGRHFAPHLSIYEWWLLSGTWVPRNWWRPPGWMLWRDQVDTGFLLTRQSVHSAVILLPLTIESQISTKSENSNYTRSSQVYLKHTSPPFKLNGRRVKLLSRSKAVSSQSILSDSGVLHIVINIKYSSFYMLNAKWNMLTTTLKAYSKQYVYLPFI